MNRLHYDGKAETWAEVYQSSDTFGQKIQRRRDAVVAAVQARLGDSRASILDVGCGTGAISRQLRFLGHQVIGVDFSQEMLATARRLTSEGGPLVEYARGSFRDLPFPAASFDAAVCVGVLGHYPIRSGSEDLVEDDVLGLREMVRVLRPGGFIVLTLPNILRLHWLLDPILLRRAFRQRRLFQRQEPSLKEPKDFPSAREARQEPVTRHQTPAEIQHLIRQGGLEIFAMVGVGFGPFTLLGRPVFSNERSVSLSARLEKIAQAPGLKPLNRLAGTWVLTVKPEGVARGIPRLPTAEISSKR